MAALVRFPAAPYQVRSSPPSVYPCMVRTVYTCGLPQSSCPVARAVSGAGVSSVPSTSAAFSASFRASSTPAASNAASTGRHRSGRDLPASARPAHHQVLGPPQRDRRQVKHLHAGGDLSRRAGQADAAARPPPRLQPRGLMGARAPPQPRPRVAFLPALPPARPPPPCPLLA